MSAKLTTEIHHNFMQAKMIFFFPSHFLEQSFNINNNSAEPISEKLVITCYTEW